MNYYGYFNHKTFLHCISWNCSYGFIHITDMFYKLNKKHMQVILTLNAHLYVTVASAGLYNSVSILNRRHLRLLL